MAILLLLAVFATTLAAAMVYLVLLLQSLSTRIWLPGAVGLIAAGVVVAFSDTVSLPVAVRVVTLPVLAAAISACAVTRRRQWPVILRAEVKPTKLQTLCILSFAAIGLAIGVASGVGKPVMIALGQDVVGVLPSEKREIAVAGGLFASWIGAMVGVLPAAALPTAGRTAANHEEEV